MARHQPGDQIDNRYVVTQLLSAGGMGEVYKAVDSQLFHRPVAIKLLHQDIGRGNPTVEEQLRRRFEDEARVSTLLGEHPQIIKVLDYGIENFQPYLVTEFLAGKSLESLISQEAPLAIDRFVRLARQICAGLQHAHQFEAQIGGQIIKGVIHRDIKPSNIFVIQDDTWGETIKILDFGIAKVVSDASVALGTLTTGFLGTVRYASPEQMRGELLDYRSDVYSLGVVLYQMLSGDLPLTPTSDTFPGWYQGHNFLEPKPLNTVDLPHPLPPELDRIIMACLAKDPDQRPGSMQVLSNDLEAAIRPYSSNPGFTAPPTPSPQPSTPVIPATLNPVSPVTSGSSGSSAPSAQPTSPTSTPKPQGSTHSDQATQPHSAASRIPTAPPIQASPSASTVDLSAPNPATASPPLSQQAPADAAPEPTSGSSTPDSPPPDPNELSSVPQPQHSQPDAFDPLNPSADSTQPRKGPPPFLYIAAGLVLLIGGGLAYRFLISSPLPDPSPVVTDPSTNGSQTSSDPPSAAGSSPSLSAGETVLLENPAAPSKAAGAEQLAQDNPSAAVPLLEQARQEDRNDPEALIYLNNARSQQQGDPLTLAAVVPISSNPDRARETLRGVAHAQNTFIELGGINGQLLQIVIADDNDEAARAATVAQTLVDRPEILGVIGHNSSNATIAAAEIYQAAGLPMISSTSTSTAISTLGNSIFRTVPSDQFAGTQMARYTLQDLQLSRSVVFYNPESSYSTSLRNAFSTTLASEGGQVITEFNLASPDFDPEAALETTQSQNAQVIFLAPNNATAPPSRAVLQANAAQPQPLATLGGDVLFSFDTLDQGGTAAAGLVVAIPWHPAIPDNQAFAQSGVDLWGGQISWRTALAHDATAVLLAGLQAAASPSREDLREALNQSGFSLPDGASGIVRFLPSGDRDAPNVLVRVEPGSQSGTGFDFVPIL